jgi:hypothetical protein
MTWLFADATPENARKTSNRVDKILKEKTSFGRLEICFTLDEKAISI